MEKKYKDIGLVEAGDIAALCGLTSVSVGDIIGCSDSVPQTVKWVLPLLQCCCNPYG